MSAWLRRRARLENDKGNLWLGQLLERLADRLDRRT